MKNLLIPLLLTTALLSGCHNVTVRHGVYVPPVVHHDVHLPARVQVVEHRHLHNREVLVHRHKGGEQTSHRHAQFNHHGPSRVVVVKTHPVVKPRPVIPPHVVLKPRVVEVPQGRGGHHTTRGRVQHDNRVWRREGPARRDHRDEASNRLNIWKVNRDAPHHSGDRNRSRHENGNNDQRRDNDGRSNGRNDNQGHDGNRRDSKAYNGKASNGKANSGKANNGKANRERRNKEKPEKVARNNNDKREKQEEGRGKRRER